MVKVFNELEINITSACCRTVFSLRYKPAANASVKWASVMIMKLWKLIWSFFVLTAALLPVGVQASSWLDCEVLAKVEEVRTKSATNSAPLRAVKIRLLRNPYACDGHSIPRKHSKGEDVWVEIVSEINSEKIMVGKQFKFKYEAYKGVGPNGLVESEEWSVLEIVK